MWGSQVFEPIGQTITLTTNAVASTPTTRPILVTDIQPGVQLPAKPIPRVRIRNSSATTAIFLLFARTAVNAVLPAAGTTTVGTPEPGFFVYPGETEFFDLPAFASNVGGKDPPVAGIFLSDISTGTSISYDLTFGE